ncbi:glycosyltransferase family 2 protein [Methylocystis sp. WRRC1]|uniref:glycosyltransferase family 2 protein n=1 Tax=Methylocystis sp. WRRC1 TaxID=1732014 RepID=UPI001D13B1EA|nr:glycosyltransferase family 2 protein [Methylocystis sp. WRRC1]MCC3245813.1 glycosyltransferase family 2 protein [Methylocystis sp. WRRC1]
MKTISIVTPCYNEEMNVRECYAAIRTLFDNELKGYVREHVFCDNASTDRTVEILREIAAEDKNVRVILNARNFGPMRSNYNGVMAATGDAVLLFFPADMQDPPELIPQFVELWAQGYEVVYGIRKIREENATMRALRQLYYRMLTSLSELSLPRGVGDFQLVDRKVIEAMRMIEDSYPFMRMMTFECGFRSVGVSYKWVERRRGVSRNSLLNLIDQGMNGLVTNTLAPLRLLLFGGFVIAALALAYAFFNLVLGVIYYRTIAQPGIMTIITAVFFFGGVQLFSIGVLAEYVLAIYAQVRRKPVVFERERINF